MENPLIIPNSYTYKQIADFAYIAESMNGFDFMYKNGKSKESLDALIPNSSQLQARYNSFKSYLDNFGITLDQFKKLDVKSYFNIKGAKIMRHTTYLKNVFFRYYNPKLTEKLYEFYKLVEVNKLSKTGTKKYFGYRNSQTVAIVRAYRFGKLLSLPSNEEYNNAHNFKNRAVNYMLLTSYIDIPNQKHQFDINIKDSINLTMKLMLLVIDGKDSISYSEFIDRYNIDKNDILSERRYTTIIDYYRRYRGLISQYKELVEDINNGVSWHSILYKYQLKKYNLKSRDKFVLWLDKVAPIKALIKKEI